MMIDLGVCTDEACLDSSNAQRRPAPGRHLVLLALLAISMAATGCTQPGGSKADADDATAQAVVFPDFAPRYPGSTITKHETQTTMGDAKGTILVLETSDSIVKVIGFYDARAKSAGLEPELAVDEDDSAIRIYDGGGVAGKGGMISVSQGDGDSRTSIVITAGQSAIAAVERQEIQDEAGPQQAAGVAITGR